MDKYALNTTIICDAHFAPSCGCVAYSRGSNSSLVLADVLDPNGVINSNGENLKMLSVKYLGYQWIRVINMEQRT